MAARLAHSSPTRRRPANGSPSPLERHSHADESPPPTAHRQWRPPGGQRLEDGGGRQRRERLGFDDEGRQHLLRAIDAAGIRDRFYRLNLYCGNGLNAALVPLFRGPVSGGTTYGNSTDTNNGPFVSGDYVETGATGGLVGNFSKYLNTGLPMDYATASGLANSDRHLAVYKNAVADGTRYSVGVVDSGAPLTLYQLVRVGSNNSYFSGGNTTSAGAADNTGLWVGTGTVSRVLYRNGTSVASNATGSDTVNAATRPFFVFAQNNNGSAVGTSDERQSAYSIGASMTATQVSDYYTALQAFQTALGRNV